MPLPEEDAKLLHRYAAEKSEEAFAELVQRHLAPVYAFALRRVGGDAHLAEDVAQIAFTTLARKAASLTDRPVLGGWLCRTAHFAARDIVRTESRRRAREEEAHIMHESPDEDPGAKIDWEKLHPMLARTLGELNDDDRDAVWLRFFEGRSFAEVGTRLRLTENAARMRVERALDKLHSLLARQGITSTAAVLGVALAGQAGASVPAGLAASVTGAALAGGTTAVGVAAIFMSITKTQAGVVALLALIGVTSIAVQARSNAGLRRETASLQEQQPTIAALRTENRQLAANIAEVALLRRDDAELKQLSQTVAELKKSSEEQARRAATSAPNPRREKEAQLLADQSRAQAEVDRMKLEAVRFAAELTQLSDQARNESLAADERARADSAAKQKIAAIEMKKREIQVFIENSRQAMIQRMTIMHQVYPGDGSTILPPEFPTLVFPDFQSSVGSQPPNPPPGASTPVSLP